MNTDKFGQIGRFNQIQHKCFVRWLDLKACFKLILGYGRCDFVLNGLQPWIGDMTLALAEAFI